MKYALISISLIFIIPSSVRGAEEQNLKIFLRPGLFAGYETRTEGYEESSYRMMLELGPQWSYVPIKYLDKFESISLDWRFIFSLNDWDVRHSIGPKLEWRLNHNWSTTILLAPVFGQKSRYSTGIHTSIGVKYRDLLSMDLLYYSMPPGRDLKKYTDDNIRSIYGGITLYGRKGGYTALVIIVVFVAVTIVIMQDFAEGLGGLN